MRAALAAALLLCVGCAADAPASAEPTADTRTAGPDLSGVPDALHGCLPDYILGSNGRYFETARLSTSDGTRVLIERVDPDDPTEATRFRPALLGLDGDACEAYMANAPLSPYVLRSYLPRYDEMIAQRYRWRAEAFGGPDAFVEAWTQARAPLPAVECPNPGTLDLDVDCVPQPDAAALRAVGVDIAPPAGSAAALPDSASALGGVPADLRACIPPAALQEEGDVEVVGTLPDGTDRLVLYTVYPSGRALPDGEYHDYTARRDADGICTPLDSWRDNPVSDETLRLYRSEDILRSRARIGVRRAGSPDAFVEEYRTVTASGGPYACPTGTSRPDCLSGPLLDELRTLGVEVPPLPASR